MRASLLATTALVALAPTGARAACTAIAGTNQVTCIGSTLGAFVDNATPGIVSVAIGSGATISQDGVTAFGDAFAPYVGVTYVEHGPATIVNSSGAFNGHGIFAVTSGNNDVSVATHSGSQILAANNGIDAETSFNGGAGTAIVVANGAIVAGGNGVFSLDNDSGGVRLTNNGRIGFNGATNLVDPVGGHGLSAMTIGSPTSYSDTKTGYVDLANNGRIDAIGAGFLAGALGGGNIRVVNAATGVVFAGFDAAGVAVAPSAGVDVRSGGPAGVAGGAVTVVNDGAVTAAFQGIIAESESRAVAGVSGPVSVFNNGSIVAAYHGIVASSQSRPGAGASGSVVVVNNGDIHAGVGGNFPLSNFGVQASSDSVDGNSGDVQATNNGAVDTPDGAGVFALSSSQNAAGASGFAAARNNGSIRAGGSGLEGLYALSVNPLWDAGGAFSENAGSIVASRGVVAESDALGRNSGAAAVVNSGTIVGDVVGMWAKSWAPAGVAADARATNSGRIDAARGIVATSEGAVASGVAGIVNRGVVNAMSEGAYAEAWNGGAVSVRNETGGVVNSDKLNALAAYIFVNNPGLAQGGSIAVYNAGSVSAARDTAVVARREGPTSGTLYDNLFGQRRALDIGVENAGLIVGGGALAGGAYAPSGLGGDGVNARTSGQGDVSVANAGRIYGDPGIVVDAAGGGNAIVDNNGFVSANPKDAITATTTGAAGGAAFVRNDVNGLLSAVSGNGVVATHQGAGATAYVSSTSFGLLPTDVHVVNNGAIGAAGDVIGLNGVLATSSGSGAVVVENTGAILATGVGVNLGTVAVGGALYLFNGGTVTSNAAAAVAVNDFGAGGAATISNSGALRGLGAGKNTAVVAIDPNGVGGATATTIANMGFIASNAGLASDLAVGAGALSSGAVSIANGGTVAGRVELTDQADLFQNGATGVWRTSGASNFHGGDDRIVNDGRMVAVGATLVDMGAGANGLSNAGVIQVTNGASIGQAAFSATGGTLAFNNAGLIDMQNDGAHSVANTTTIVGAFNAGAGSAVAVDAQLAGPGSVADRLIVNGDATGGTTSVAVRNAAAGLGAYNPFGITVARITGANSGGGFTLSPSSPGFTLINGAPVIDAGLFVYALAQGNGAGCDGAAVCYSLYSAPSGQARRLPVAVTTTQSLWQETALMWEDRQTELRDAAVQATTADGARTRGVSAWVKPLGAWTTRGGAATVMAGPSALTVDLGYRQNSFGLVGGANYAFAGVFGGELNLGVMGGYAQSNVNFRAGQTLRYEGGTVGASASYMNRSVFIDGLFKADLLNVDFGARVGRAAADTLGGVWNLGYRLTFGQYFLEPTATLAYSATRIGAPDAVGAQGTTLRFGNGQDFRGGFGGRLGFERAGVVAGHVLEASVTGRLWDQFNSNNGRTVDILSGGSGLTLGDHALGRVYGEAKGNLALLAAGPGWGAYVSGGARFNDQFTSWTARGGLSYRW